MSPKSIRQASVCATIAALLSSTAVHGITMPELTPLHWQDTLQATDGSYQRCLLFRTVPGVVYTVEASNNLLTWSPVTGI